MRSLDVTYEAVDIEVVPSNLFGDWPPYPVRLRLGGYAPTVLAVSSFLVYYFVLVPIIFPATKPCSTETIERCKRLRDTHNLALCLYSAFCCLSTAVWLQGRGELFDWHALLCEPVEGTWIRPLSLTFTLSKLWEWADTAFIIWLGRHPPQFLHKYHHATTFWLFCFVPNLPGPEKLGLLLNGAVHALMYSHYWSRWPNAVVPLITILQIVQLATVTYAWTVSPGECPDERFASAPGDHLLAFLTPYAFVPVFLWLFIVFFVKRFVLKRSKGGGVDSKAGKAS